MAQATADENVTSISGVPTWTILLLQRILEIKGKSIIEEVWPNLEVFYSRSGSFRPIQVVIPNLNWEPKNEVSGNIQCVRGFFWDSG